MPRRRSIKKSTALSYDVIGIGASWGGVEVLTTLISALPSDWKIPIVIVQHQHPNSGRALERILGNVTSLVVLDVENNDKIQPGHVYIAPANYHLLIEYDGALSLSLEAPLNFSRPSIDVTFSCLAKVFQRRCMGVILTGANDDGAQGIKEIKAEGGYVIAQSPESAESPIMPKAAIATGAVDAVLTPEAIVPHLLHLLHHGIK